MQNTSSTSVPSSGDIEISTSGPTLRSPVTPAAVPAAQRTRIIWGEDRGAPPARPACTGTARMLVSEPDRPLALHDSWWAVALAGVLAAAALSAVLWASVHVEVDPLAAITLLIGADSARQRTH